MALDPWSAPPFVEINKTGPWQSRPLIEARMFHGHTNGSGGEVSIEAAIRYSLANPGSNTWPHYQVALTSKRVVKYMPSNRKGIASYKADWWTITAETSDRGWPVPGAIPWTDTQCEQLAQIIVHEHILSNGRITLGTPTKWDGSGVGTHTDPFAYPYWTKYDGKVCPGDPRKWQMRNVIIPRARIILAELQGGPITPPVDPPAIEGVPTMILVKGNATPPTAAGAWQSWPFIGNPHAVWCYVPGLDVYVWQQRPEFNTIEPLVTAGFIPLRTIPQALMDAVPVTSRLTTVDFRNRYGGQQLLNLAAQAATQSQGIITAAQAASGTAAAAAAGVAEVQTLLSQLATAEAERAAATNAQIGGNTDSLAVIQNKVADIAALLENGTGNGGGPIVIDGDLRLVVKSPIDVNVIGSGSTS